ncbi:hypothetical protein JCM11491_003131 [Sporobolomyces phaffii]
MGANGSVPNGATRAGPLDHYAVLGIERTATAIEIRKSFRKLALKEHPDKNPDDVEGANLRFSRIQEAYEVLSDDQERAWYDDHLDDYLDNANQQGGSGGGGMTQEDVNYFDQLRKGFAKQRDAKPPPPGRRPDRGLQVAHLMKFFSTSAWSKFDDSPTGFYTTFSTLFSLLSADEVNWSSPHLYPSFGAGSPPPAVEDLRRFYQTWLNFQTEKDFSWKDGYRVEEDMPRYMRRDIDKENQRLRQQAKREYNETVRNLVLYVRRRDPRYTSSSNPSAQASAQAEIKATLAAASKQRALERELAAKEYQAQMQDWELGQADGGHGGLESVLREWEEGSELDDNDDDNADEDGAGHGVEQEDERVWCEACGKGYRSGGAWEDHERSRKHLKNVDRLIKEMQEEDELLGLDTAEPPPPIHDPVASTSRSPSPTLSAQLDVDLSTLSVADQDDDWVPPPLSSKKKKDKKKSRKVLSSVPVSDDDDLLDDETSTRGLGEAEDEDEFDGGGVASMKKNRKKGKARGKKAVPLDLEVDREDDVEHKTLAGLESKRLDSGDEDLATGGGKRGKKGKRRGVTNTSGASTPSTILRDGAEPQAEGGGAGAADPEEGILEAEMSKKDKRRAKEAAKKAQAMSGAQVSCNVCSEVFASRSKLFNHINDTGHALAEGAASVGPGSGKKKKGKR